METQRRSPPRPDTTRAHNPRLPAARRRLGLHRAGRHRRPLRRQRRGQRCPPSSAIERQRLGNRRVRHAAALDHTRSPREAVARSHRRTHPRDPAPHRPLPARRHATSTSSASAPSPSTATSSRPTAAPAAPPSPAPTSPCVRPCEKLLRRRHPATHAPHDAVAAISVGIVDGVPLLDLDYEEDSRAEVDFNVVMTANGEFVESQGSAESSPFTRATMDELLALGSTGDPRAARGPETGPRRDATGQPPSRVLAQPGRRRARGRARDAGVWSASRRSSRASESRSGSRLWPICTATSPTWPRSVPELLLRHVLPRHDQQHHRHPAQPVPEDHDLIVLVEDLRRLSLRDDLAEQAMVDHRWLHRYARGQAWPHSR